MFQFLNDSSLYSATPRVNLNSSLYYATPEKHCFFLHYRIFCTSAALLKKAEPPMGMEKSLKLWNRLPPRVAPPSIWKLGLPVTCDRSPVGSVVSPTTCATLRLELKNAIKTLTAKSHFSR